MNKIYGRVRSIRSYLYYLLGLARLVVKWYAFSDERQDNRVSAQLECISAHIASDVLLFLPYFSFGNHHVISSLLITRPRQVEVQSELRIGGYSHFWNLVGSC